MSGIKLRTENLTVGYSGRALIGDIALSLHQGQIMTLIGPNGAGKSTILKSVIRQLALVGGAVYLNGRDMAPMPEREVARRLSVLMTGHIHPELMTCFDVAATGRYPYTGRLGILSREDREKVSQCLELVHASGLAEQDFSRISDGQRQRVLLARALAGRPESLILDDSSSALDYRTDAALRAALRKEYAGVTTVIIAQRVSSIYHADHILVLDEGRELGYGSHQELMEGCEVYREIATSQMGRGSGSAASTNTSERGLA